jgi:glycogen operon protein
VERQVPRHRARLLARRAATLAEFASRLTGSSDLYQDDSRRPLASINFVTAHDGFTLRDLVSYNEKHNDANGEGGNDGEGHNRSWNCGVEGETDDEAVLEVRARQQRNFLTTLLISQGVPMIAHGDELGRTQQGNNNVYCQDNELAWVDWNLTDPQRELLEFTRRLVRLRNDHPVLRRRRFFHGDTGSDGLGDLVWFTPEGHEMQDGDWRADDAGAVAVFLNGDAITEPIPGRAGRGRLVPDPAQQQRQAPRLPAARQEVRRLLAGGGRQHHRHGGAGADEHNAGATMVIEGRGTLVLMRPRQAAA